MMRDGRGVFVLINVLLLSPTAGAAQETIHVPFEPSCDRCRVRVERLATLGKVTDPVGLQLASHVAVDSHNRYYVAPTTEDGVVSVFNEAGDYLHGIGRFGQGPGELQYPLQVFVDADTLHVFDMARRTVFAPDGSYVRTHPFAGRINAGAFLGSGEMAFSGRMATRGGVGLPLHVLAPEGTVRLSFGSSDAELSPLHGPRLLPYVGSSGTTGTFWSAEVLRYEVSHWSGDGRLLRVFTQDPEWLEEIRAPQGVDPPTPGVVGVQEGPGGILWVMAWIADDGWRDRAPRGTGLAASVRDKSFRYDTLIEAIDPSRGIVLARITLEEVGTAFIDQTRFVSMKTDRFDDVLIDIWNVSLLGREGGQ